MRDAAADIAANREAAKAKVKQVVFRRTSDPAEQKRLFIALKRNEWTTDPFLSRLMRKHWRRGRNKTANQIVVRADQYKAYRLTEDGNVWLAVPGLERRQLVRIPLNTTVAPTGTLRLILRSGCSCWPPATRGYGIRNPPRCTRSPRSRRRPARTRHASGGSPYGPRSRR
ncbi:hypothetical protein U9R90_23040 [Streptomyces sp. E11-3]|uniref:hypothetical protein n=1 Tax=Streptomyces sp. E11-3 TaxID=3110112 RepID=UPI003980F1B4